MEFKENVMRVLRWYLCGWLGVFRFSGRARRGEFWSFYVINQVIVGLVSVFFGDVPATVFGLVQAVPLIALDVRRLHDTGRSGSTLAVLFLPLVGLVMLIVWSLRPGDVGPNRFGPDPKWPSHEPMVPVGPVLG